MDSNQNHVGLVLPLDAKWPFLLRFPISWFSISIGLASQAYLWKTLAKHLPCIEIVLHLINQMNMIVWTMAMSSLIIITYTYLMKCLLYFEAVKREFRDIVRSNFFFAPWVACLFLALGVPPDIMRWIIGKDERVQDGWVIMLMVPIIGLELKVYGQWLLGGKDRLSEVANPCTHLSVVGNFIGSLLVAKVGWQELATFLWAVGIIHYLVLFVTLYQRLPSSMSVPKELHPVFFLFVAAPSTASVAWKTIVGDFDYLSRICYFMGLFLYTALVVRLNFFRGFPFSITWWAFLYPMTSAAIATIHYSHTMKHPLTFALAIALSIMSTITVFGLFLSTIFHGVFLGTLFPNDVVIMARTQTRKRKHMREKVNVDDNTKYSKHSLHSM